MDIFQISRTILARVTFLIHHSIVGKIEDGSCTVVHKNPKKVPIWRGRFTDCLKGKYLIWNYKSKFICTIFPYTSSLCFCSVATGQNGGHCIFHFRRIELYNVYAVQKKIDILEWHTSRF